MEDKDFRTIWGGDFGWTAAPDSFYMMSAYTLCPKPPKRSKPIFPIEYSTAAIMTVRPDPGKMKRQESVTAFVYTISAGPDHQPFLVRLLYKFACQPVMSALRGFSEAAVQWIDVPECLQNNAPGPFQYLFFHLVSCTAVWRAGIVDAVFPTEIFFAQRTESGIEHDVLCVNHRAEI